MMRKNVTFLAISSRLEVKSVCERTFQNTGLYYFHLENYDADWADDDVTSSFCLVKVTQTDRYICQICRLHNYSFSVD